MKTALGSPCASRVRLPELANVPAALAYVPGVTICDANSDPRIMGVGALMSLKRVTRSVCAVFATVSAMCRIPELVTLVSPVNEVPGKSPTSPPAVPLMTVGPVFVMVVAPRTPKVEVLPGRIVGTTADEVGG